jgi:hypothetical protein
MIPLGLSLVDGYPYPPHACLVLFCHFFSQHELTSFRASISQELRTRPLYPIERTDGFLLLFSSFFVFVPVEETSHIVSEIDDFSHFRSVPSAFQLLCEERERERERERREERGERREERCGELSISLTCLSSLLLFSLLSLLNPLYSFLSFSLARSSAAFFSSGTRQKTGSSL